MSDLNNKQHLNKNERINDVNNASLSGACLPFSENHELNRFAMKSFDSVSELLGKSDFVESVIKLAHLSAMQHRIVLSPFHITHADNQKSIAFSNELECKTWLNALRIADRFTLNTDTLDAANGQTYKLLIHQDPSILYEKINADLSTYPEDFNQILGSIETALIDAVTQNTNNYQIGSTCAADRFTQAGLSGQPLTVFYFELTCLSHANNLSAQGNLLGGHEVGNILVREANAAIKQFIQEMDPDSLVFRGPNGAVIVISEKLEHSDVGDVILDISRAIENRFPESQNLIERGVRGHLRLGTSTTNPADISNLSIISRDLSKQIYYQTLREAGACAEYTKQLLSADNKVVPSAVNFQEITSKLDPQDFLHRFHNFIPPEARNDTLFVVRDQIDKVLETLKKARAEHVGLFYKTPEEALAEELYVPMLQPLKEEATCMFEMLKRPERFAYNVNDVAEGRSIPILNIREGSRLELRLINEKTPFYRADGDLDHLRDAFKAHRVYGADEYYAGLYDQIAENLKKYQDKFNSFNKQLSIFIVKQSNSDEYSLILIGADRSKLESILEISRKSVETAGKELFFDKYDKYTGELLEVNGSVTTTLACIKKEILTQEDLDLVKEENEAILNFRKLIPGKNTAGDFDVSEEEVLGIRKKLEQYAGFNYPREDQKAKAKILVSEAFKAYSHILVISN